jgi:hypothetical protein
MTAADNKPPAERAAPARRELTCPICGKPRSEAYDRSARSAAPTSTFIAG